MRIKRVFLFTALTLLLACGVIAFLIVTPISYDSPRARGSEVLMGLIPARESVAANVAKNKTLTGSGSGVTLETSTKEHSLNSAVVTQDGVIFGYNKHYGIAILLEPSIVQGKLYWRCIAMPLEAAPHFCRPESRPLTTQSR